jgi:hypothetical protein
VIQWFWRQYWLAFWQVTIVVAQELAKKQQAEKIEAAKALREAMAVCKETIQKPQAGRES